MTTYSVASEAVEGATITFDHADGKYEAGETVTVTATVTDPAKAFSSFSSEEVTIVVSEKSDDKAVGTFIMPEKDVAVSVVLEAREYAISSIQVYNVEVPLTITGASEGDLIEVGKEVKLVLDAGDFTYFSEDRLSYFYVHVNGSVFKPTLPEGTTGWSTKAEVSFPMPAGDADIVIVSSINAISDSGHTLTVEENENVEAYGYSDAEKYTSVNLFVKKQAGYKIDKVETKTGSGEWTEVANVIRSADVLTLSVSLSGDTIVRFVGEEVGSHSITWENADAVDYDLGQYLSALPTEATEGDTFVISGITPKNEEYHLSSEPASFVGLPAENVLTNATTYGNGRLEFVMPDQDITIRFLVEENGSIIFLPNENVEKAVAVGYNSSYEQVEITKQAPGESFNVYITAKEGFIVSSISVNGGEPAMVAPTTSKFGDYTAYVSMPDEGDANITINTVVGYDVTAQTSEHGEIVFSRDVYAAGETVSFTFNPTEPKYSIKNVTYEGAEDGAVSYDPATRRGSFIMPEKDVHLTFEEDVLASTNITLEAFDTEILSSVSVTGNQSRTSLTQGGKTGEFLVGETVSVNAYMNYAYSSYQYGVHVYTVDAQGQETELTRDDEWSPFTFTVTEEIVSIKVAIVENEPLVVTFAEDIPEGVTFSYSVDWTPVDTLEGNVFPGMDVSISLATGVQAPEGYGYAIKVTDDVTGEEMDASGFTPTNNFTVSVELVEAVTVSWSTIETDPEAYPMANILIGDSYYSLNSTREGSAFCLKGQTLNITCTMDIAHITITDSGNPENNVDEDLYGYMTYSIAPVGNIEIVFTVGMV